MKDPLVTPALTNKQTSERIRAHVHYQELPALIYVLRAFVGGNTGAVLEDNALGIAISPN